MLHWLSYQNISFNSTICLHQIATEQFWLRLHVCVWIICQTDSWTALTFDITVTCVRLCIFFRKRAPTCPKIWLSNLKLNKKPNLNLCTLTRFGNPLVTFWKVEKIAKSWNVGRAWRFGGEYTNNLFLIWSWTDSVEVRICQKQSCLFSQLPISICNGKILKFYNSQILKF